MVDILRNPDSDLKATSRYIVDPCSTGVHWIPHTLPFEVEQDTYQSCVGRVPDAFVDGIYTAGSLKGVTQMSYVPLFNSSGSAAPMPTRLLLPNKTLATAIASAPYPGGITDFYAVSDSTLYPWSSNQQLRDHTVGTALLTKPVFASTDTPIALIHDGITTIFGKNSSDVLYYISCQINHLADSIMTGTFIFYPEAMDPNPRNPRRIPAALLGAAGGVILVAIDFLLATIFLEKQFISILRKVTGIVTVLFKCLFCIPAQKFFDKYEFLKGLVAGDSRKIDAIFDMVVAAPAFFCVFYHPTSRSLARKLQGRIGLWLLWRRHLV